jgi:hypothetical protein
MTDQKMNPGDCGPEARQVSSSADRRDLPTKANERKQVDRRNHAVTIYDGQDRVGSLLERGGTHAYDVAGHCVGIFSDMRAAARSLPVAGVSP